MTPTEQQTAEGVLFTDMYQLTMAQLYFRQGLHERQVQFDYFFRTYPDYGRHEAGYCVAAGLEWLLDWMERARFRDEDLDYLRGAKASTGACLFDEDFLTWLKACGNFADVRLSAVPEGRVVHAGAPVAVVQGPFAMTQILETSLLNHLNYPTLIATKAARVKREARGSAVIDFGMRRGHERGVNAGTRAALIGGVDFTSNTGLSFVLGLPPKGTHAHSMVQGFMALGLGELAAFEAYAEAYPDDCLLLVDTVDTLASGVPNAIQVFERLRRQGHKPVGVRLDSGDLAFLSIQTAKLLDAAGFEDASIVLSNRLDEFTIWQIVTQIAAEARSYGVDPDALIKRLSYGVGTSLMISQGDSALDGVYKLVAIEENGAWQPAIKLSNTPAKTLNPGDKRLWRLYDERGKATADLVSLSHEDPRQEDTITLHHPSDARLRRTLQRNAVDIEPLLEPVFAGGKRTVDAPPLASLRERCETDLARLDAGVKRLLNPHIYHVSLTEALWNLKQDLVRSAKV